LSHRALYAVGKIVKAFGLGGEVVVRPTSSEHQRFKALKSVYVGDTDDDAIEASVIDVKIDPRGVRVKLENAPDRTSAEQLVGKWLFVDEHDMMKLPRGTYFVHDLVGLHVVNEHDQPMGVLKEVLKLPANDIYVVQREGREVLIPAVKEFVLAVDLRTKTMKVKVIPGMDELNEN
jgi:16S rRNA processing protein RimM